MGADTDEPSESTPTPPVLDGCLRYSPEVSAGELLSSVLMAIILLGLTRTLDATVRRRLSVTEYSRATAQRCAAELAAAWDIYIRSQEAPGISADSCRQILLHLRKAGREVDAIEKATFLLSRRRSALLRDHIANFRSNQFRLKDWISGANFPTDHFVCTRSDFLRASSSYSKLTSDLAEIEIAILAFQ